MNNEVDEDPSCECTHHGASHLRSVHTDKGCGGLDSYGLLCTCPGFEEIKDYHE